MRYGQDKEPVKIRCESSTVNPNELMSAIRLGCLNTDCSAVVGSMVGSPESLVAKCTRDRCPLNKPLVDKILGSLENRDAGELD